MNSKYWWYTVVVAMIKKYDVIRKDDSEQARRMTLAIETAFDQTARMDSGEQRCRAVEMQLLRNMGLWEVSHQMNYSWRTIQEWTTLFVKMVGENAGF